MHMDPDESPSISITDKGEASKTSENKQSQLVIPGDGQNKCPSLSNPGEEGMSRASWRKKKVALIKYLYKEEIENQTVKIYAKLLQTSSHWGTTSQNTG